jgi:hypothetical protein
VESEKIHKVYNVKAYGNGRRRELVKREVKQRKKLKHFGSGSA